MPRMLDPFQFVLVAVAGWMNQRQQQTIEYLREENRVLREQLGDRRVRFNDDQRRRLAVRAKGLGRKLLAEVATLVTPDTLLVWHRKLIAQKYDGRNKRGRGRPRTGEEIEALVVRMAEENRAWGYRRIQGAISNLGHKLARSTIADVLRRQARTSRSKIYNESRRSTWCRNAIPRIRPLSIWGKAPEPFSRNTWTDGTACLPSGLRREISRHSSAGLSLAFIP